jgi:hypothetical protein
MEDIERIARLEAQHQLMMQLLQETRDDIKTMREDMHQVRDSLTKWKGIGGGIVIAVSLIWSAGLALWSIFSPKG